MRRTTLTYAATAGFVGGIFVASVVEAWQPDYLFFVLLSFVLFTVAWRHRHALATPLLTTVAICCLVFSFGSWRTVQYAASLQQHDPLPVGETVTLHGLVVAEPDVRETTTHVYLAAASTTILIFADRFTDVAYGDRVVVTGKVALPESFTTEFGRTFNYPGYLAARGVTHTMSFADMTIEARGQGNPVIATLLAVKAEFLDRISHYLPEPQAGLAQGLLLGVKQALGDDLEHVFRSTGIIHIVVLSGYNIMLVVAFVLYVLSFILPLRGRLVVGLLAIVGFALMVGLSATVVRASLMAALALIARAIGRTYLVIHALFVAGVVMLVFNPYLLVYDVGFQLSFLATLGLILLAPQLEHWLSAVPNAIGVREFLLATLATQIVVMPLLLYQIGEFSVVAVLVNVLVLPLVPVAMLTTFVMVAVSFFSAPVAALIGYLAYGSLVYIIETASFFATLPFAAFVVPQFSFGWVVLAYVALSYVAYWLYHPCPVDELAGWTIEEESGDTATTTTAPRDEVPVFFRSQL